MFLGLGAWVLVFEVIGISRSESLCQVDLHVSSIPFSDFRY